MAEIQTHFWVPLAGPSFHGFPRLKLQSIMNWNYYAFGDKCVELL